MNGSLLMKKGVGTGLEPLNVKVMAESDLEGEIGLSTNFYGKAVMVRFQTDCNYITFVLTSNVLILTTYEPLLLGKIFFLPIAIVQEGKILEKKFVPSVPALTAFILVVIVFAGHAATK